MNKFVLLAVTGNPIAYSKSPQMLNAALAATKIQGIDMRLAANSAKDAIETAKSLGIVGINVTAPFKEQMVELMDELSDEATEIDAVNTITIENGETKGYNTDTQGVVGALEGNGIELKGKNLLILGAGGAAKAAAFGLTKSGAKVTIANRTVSKAKVIAEKFGCEFCEIGTTNFEEVMKNTEIIVSTLSTAEKVVESSLLTKEIILFDAVYGKETQLTKDAKVAECRIINGQEWLLYHCVKTFEIFTGKKVSIEVLRKAVGGTNTMTKQNIALVGFSGSGKSTVSEEIRKLTGAQAIHMDEEIEGNAGRSITEIFEKEGETAFRKMESEMIEEITRHSGKIISCGGGTIIAPQNIEALKRNCKVIWLSVKLETIIKRIGNNKSRPLFDVDGKEEKIRGMMQVRHPMYAKSCDLVISTDDKSPEEIAKLIVSEVGDCLKGKKS